MATIMYHDRPYAGGLTEPVSADEVVYGDSNVEDELDRLNSVTDSLPTYCIRRYDIVGYSLNTNYTETRLRKKPYGRFLLVVYNWAFTNSLMLSPSVIELPANSQTIKVVNAWNNQTNQLMTSGTVDLTLIDFAY